MVGRVGTSFRILNLALGHDLHPVSNQNTDEQRRRLLLPGPQVRHSLSSDGIWDLGLGLRVRVRVRVRLRLRMDWLCVE